MKIRACIVCNASLESTNRGAKFCKPACYYDFHAIRKEGCWAWTGRVNGDGYGRIRQKGQKAVMAHRYAYERFIGPIQYGLWVLHTCDNPPCTNPEHLYQGTCVENGRDTSVRQRNRKSRNKGSKNPNAQLCPWKIRAIRQSKKACSLLAKRFAVSCATISMVKNKKRWTHI